MFWGRQNGKEKCISNFYKDPTTRTSECLQTSSQAESLLETLQYNCNKIKQCDFQLPRWNLGNPCPGNEVSKYLNITYDCIKKREKHVTLIYLEERYQKYL